MRKFLLCSGVLLTSLNVYSASTPIASVVKIRGNVTKLLPGALEASAVHPDDKFPEDTSIVTAAKSFIKIKFVDNSELNMGPDSKIVISEMGTETPGIISLLKGRIRTEVQKANSPGQQTKNKFYIRTRTAAMGVRGTDFQTIYNPDNRMTSLLTYKGAVAMAKIDENTHQSFEESTTQVERVDKDRAPEVKVIPGKAIEEKDMMINVLNSPGTVIVPPGQNSFTSNALKKSSLPVKISPVQLNALYKNREFNEKNSINMKSGVDAVNPKLEISAAAQTAPAEGLYNAKSGDFAPKAGGFIDSTTGLYIAPEDSADYDPENGIYKSTKSGNFDVDTGDYFAPKGLVLDARQGFILEKNVDMRPELLALREDLNRTIARDIVVGDLEGEVLIASKKLNEKFIRDRLSLSVEAGNQKLDLTPKTGAAPANDLEAEGVFKFSVLWQLASTKRLTPLLGLSFSRVNYGELAKRGEASDSKSLFAMTTGLKYALTNRVDLFTTLVLDQAHYANPVSTTPALYQYKRIVMTRINLGVEAEVARSNRFSLMGEALANFAFRKKFNNQTVSNITGFNFKLTPQYLIDEKRAVGLGIYAGMEKSTTGNSLSSTEQKRNDLGIELKYIIDL